MHVLERGWLSSNNILFFGEDENVIIDTGYVTHAEQTLQLVQHVLGNRPLHKIYNTHLHSDHCGGNKILHDHYQAQIAIPEAEFYKVNDWDYAKLSFQATGQKCDRFEAHALVKPNDKLMLGDLEWVALAAPGHDPHSLVLYCEKEGLLISADALWEKGFGVIFPELDGRPGFDETRATLDLISELDIRLVIPGHGSPFTDVKKSLEVAYSRIAYLEEDPKRNAQHGIKVLLKFLLMERQRIKLTEVPELLSKVPLVTAANRNYMNYGTIHLAHWVVTQLRRAGAAVVDNEFLVDSEPNR
jgi:glyoxylase-like metal-dependent hydrolase (beta-lactamase superfamily II)